MAERTIEDQLREEYAVLPPYIRRTSEQLESEVRYHLLPISRDLHEFEQLVVESRVKDCESAIEALRRRQEGKTFDRDRPEIYSLTSLKDLAGVRVLAFPPRRLTQIDDTLRLRFPAWESDPIRDGDRQLALKYSGLCQTGDRVRAEYQIVSMLTGLFWEVEHSAMYKPAPRFRGVADSLEMRQRWTTVLEALEAFETGFEKLVSRKKKKKERKNNKRMKPFRTTA
jgi:ppGpp synthetase/RelA/SpoT-type nucleotidyltranferase